MLHKQRRYGLEIWGLGLGFYLFYTPYSGLTKALSIGLLPGMHGPIRGTVLLPVVAIATVVGMLGFITVMRWWKYAGRREFFGISIPFPRRLTFLSGVCMATIMGTTTLAFTFGGLSIVLVLVLLRGGTLIIAPVVDGLVGRRVRWFSWAAMFISLMAVCVILSDAAHYKLTLAAILDVGAYLIAYFFKLQFMSRLAKLDEKIATRRYFVEEQMIASPLLVVALAVMALIGVGDVMTGFRVGLTTFLNTPAAGFAALVGLFYAALCICTTLIFLDRRENTFCMPMHCGSSMLSGFTASAALAYFYNQNSLSMAQTISAGFIVVALGFLSPLHHFDRFAAKLRNAFARLRLKPTDFIPNVSGGGATGLGPLAKSPIELTSPLLSDQEHTTNPSQIFLFVCSGNTCRSPMASAIANAEIAARLRIPFTRLGEVNVKAISAGVSARVGTPMTAEAKQALRELGFYPNGHKAKNITVGLADQAERILCMTQAHRSAVIELIPGAAVKTQCLDPDGDVEDPIGSGLPAYIDCARRIHDLVKLRFDEIGLRG